MVTTVRQSLAGELSFTGRSRFPSLSWIGPESALQSQTAGVRAQLLDLDQPLWLVSTPPGVRLAAGGETAPASAQGMPVLAAAPALPIDQLGDPDFCRTYHTRYAYYGGAMANGIASAEMVIALGQAGMLGSFGAAGLSPSRVEAAIVQIQQALPAGNYAFNLINSPFEPEVEQRMVELYLQRGIHVIEASAYLDVTTPIALYRAAGLSVDASGQAVIGNRIIVKLSRKEVARKFMEPVPEDLLQRLLGEGRISETQAELARRLPVADDVTVEADSGGHTDNRPLVCLMPTILALRDEVQAERGYAVPVRVGAGGGISTPAAALAAFMMGAAYIVTGSVNQSCRESGTSDHVRNLLGQAGMADMIMAPAADMFEMGVKVQVLRRGTLFPVRAQKLYEIYTRYECMEQIPAGEREKLEKQIFRRSLDEVWADTETFFTTRDPRQVERARQDPKHKMALVFRWYMGLSSRWPVLPEPGREMDYQIWCGPSLGTFNDWVRGTSLEQPQNRHVADVARHLLTGCAYLYRLRALQAQGLRSDPELDAYRVEG